MRVIPFALVLASLLATAAAAGTANAATCQGVVWEDANGNGWREAGERALADVAVSDGERIALTDAQGRYALPLRDGRTVFLIKPASHGLPTRADGLPDFWFHLQSRPGPALRYGGIPAAPPQCRDFGLRPRAEREGAFEVLLTADSQVGTRRQLDYYRRDIVQPLAGRHRARLGLTLGDIVNDDLDLAGGIIAANAQLELPWLYVPGNHDMDLDAARDEDALLSFRRIFGPDTFAWEEPGLVFIGLDDVIHQPGEKPAYVGGLREEQFAFLRAYLPRVDKQRLLVVGVHIPFFDEGFRARDRQRLFALLADFPHVLLLSGHTHTQRHWHHDAGTGWHGSTPLHEYNVGAACGAFWSGIADAEGIPDATMADGTPNGHAYLRVEAQGRYRLSWHPARDPDRRMRLHAPRVLRRGAWPAHGVYANVFNGDERSVVEYRIGDGEWKPMRKVLRADPWLLAENLRDDEAADLRGYDRAPEAVPSQHLWRGTLPTDLAPGLHRIEVRALEAGQSTRHHASIEYELRDPQP
ncbi:calcineurin-like phosphoesterase C-terminal domain-containing protein [Pseudoxanthomonas mexicana]|uniref:calcineurin-like phosphoesterase C-terminal domain-containing protein n=1 Tax=Pseudoxanthomonas mexicana TaxID=128785 RepID=UPI00398A77A2